MSVEIPETVIADWHSREPKWRMRMINYTVAPLDEDDGPIVVTRPSRVATVTIALERDREGEGMPPETQTVVASGYVVITDPPTLLLAFPLEEL